MAFRKSFKGKGRKVMRKSTRKPVASLATLKKDIAILKKKTAVVMERDQFRSSDATDVISPYAALHLTDYASWSRLWPSSSQVFSSVKSKMYHRYTIIDNLVTLDNVNNEEGEINFTYFVFSTKDEAGALSMSLGVPSLTNNVDYSLVNGLAYLNLKKFKIHYMKRFTLTGGDGTDMQADRCSVRFQAKVKVNAKVQATDSEWKALTSSPDPSDNLYHILFTDNSSTDLENPRWSWSALHSVDQ